MYSLIVEILFAVCALICFSLGEALIIALSADFLNIFYFYILHSVLFPNKLNSTAKQLSKSQYDDKSELA